MKKENYTVTDSGLGYEGFCIDLLNELREKLQFDYELELKESFGERQHDGTWNGIIGELTRKVNPVQSLGVLFISLASVKHVRTWERVCVLLPYVIR